MTFLKLTLAATGILLVASCNTSGPVRTDSEPSIASTCTLTEAELFDNEKSTTSQPTQHKPSPQTDNAKPAYSEIDAGCITPEAIPE